MLASINPLGERGRNQRYAVTVDRLRRGIDRRRGRVRRRCSARSVARLPRRPLRALGVGVLAAVGHRVSTHACAAHAFRARAARSTRTGSRRTGAGSTAPASVHNSGVAFATIVTASATWVAFACAFVSGSPARRRDRRRRSSAVARAVPILATRAMRDAASLRARVRAARAAPAPACRARRRPQVAGDRGRAPWWWRRDDAARRARTRRRHPDAVGGAHPPPVGARHGRADAPGGARGDVPACPSSATTSAAASPI